MGVVLSVYVKDRAQMTQVWPSVCRGTPWHGCWCLQGAEPEDGQEGVDGNTHQGGEAPACHLYLGSSYCLDLPAPSPPSH